MSGTPSPHRGRWFAFGAVSGAAAAAVAVAIWSLLPAIPVACPAIAYENTSPIELRLPDTLGDDIEVAACFDMNCTPTPITPNSDGIYEVPQEAPFLGEGETLPVSVTGVRVEVHGSAGIEIDNRFGISTVSDTPPGSQCPGPFEYSPVAVSG